MCVCVWGGGGGDSISFGCAIHEFISFTQALVININTYSHTLKWADFTGNRNRIIDIIFISL